ncbi:hypothetical protein FQR65_LT15367 [Abscondita terminalis]|nr:hypothetical protein FQR65_LT15367 [Abscondita terminalis]
MTNRKDTLPVMVGNLKIGGSDNVILQSMTTTKTHDIKATLKQIEELVNEGCQIVRVAVLGLPDAEALPTIVKESPVPIVADIHFNFNFALMAADAGCAKIRINPGNIGIEENVIKVVEKCREKNIPIRIGVNSAHIGITEAGSLLSGAIKSSFGLGVLLFNGIGSTIRISLAEDPVLEIKVAKRLLNSLGLYENIVEVIACPTCGRLEYDIRTVVQEIEEYTEKLNFPLKIAILGCVVNGPGEASQADIGIAGGKDGGIIFKKGKIFKTVHQDLLVSELKTLIDEYYIN